MIIIQGFNATSTLKIAAGKLDTLIRSNGEDLFLTVGENVITVTGAAALEKVNVVNAKSQRRGNQGRGHFQERLGQLDDNYINNSGSKVLINAGDGLDTIQGFNDTSTLQSAVKTNGSDLYHHPEKCKLVNAKGKAIKFTVTNVNTISNDVDRVVVNGSDDRDKIYNAGYNVSINAGTGDDSITNFGVKSSLAGGAGNDSISNGDSTVKIYGEAGDDYIVNYGSKVTLDSGDGNDSVENFESKVTVQAGVGDDSIYNNSSLVSIDAGEGNDSVFAAYIFAAENEDLPEGGDSTIIGGKGDDYLSSFGKGRNIFIYRSGDGLDTIAFQSNDTIKIVADSKITTDIQDGDVILSVDDGSITFKDAAYCRRGGQTYLGVHLHGGGNCRRRVDNARRALRRLLRRGGLHKRRRLELHGGH